MAKTPKHLEVCQYKRYALQTKSPVQREAGENYKGQTKCGGGLVRISPFHTSPLLMLFLKNLSNAPTLKSWSWEDEEEEKKKNIYIYLC